MHTLYAVTRASVLELIHHRGVQCEDLATFNGGTCPLDRRFRGAHWRGLWVRFEKRGCSRRRMYLKRGNSNGVPVRV